MTDKNKPLFTHANLKQTLQSVPLEELEFSSAVLTEHNRKMARQKLMLKLFLPLSSAVIVFFDHF